MKNVFDSLNRLDYAVSRLPENLDVYDKADIDRSNHYRPIKLFSHGKLKEEELKPRISSFVEELNKLYSFNDLPNPLHERYPEIFQLVNSFRACPDR